MDGIGYIPRSVAASTVAAAVTGSKLLGPIQRLWRMLRCCAAMNFAGMAAHLIDGREGRGLSDVNGADIEAVLLPRLYCYRSGQRLDDGARAPDNVIHYLPVAVDVSMMRCISHTRSQIGLTNGSGLTGEQFLGDLLLQLELGIGFQILESAAIRLPRFELQCQTLQPPVSHAVFSSHPAFSFCDEQENDDRTANYRQTSEGIKPSVPIRCQRRQPPNLGYTAAHITAINMLRRDLLP